MAVKLKPNGKWHVDAKKPGVKRYRATFPTKELALEAERCYLGGLVTPNVPLRGTEKVTIKDLYDNALKSPFCGWTKDSQQAMNGWRIVQHFGPERVAEDITDTHVRQMVVDFAQNRGIGKSMQNKYLSAISKMYDTAREDGLITHKPNCKHIPVTKAERNRRIRFLKREEEAEFLTAVRLEFGAAWERYMIVLIETGFRTRELGYAYMRDVDLAKSRISAVENTHRGIKGGSRIIPLTKRARAAIDAEIATHQLGETRLFPWFAQSTLNKTVWNTLRNVLDDHSKDFVPHMLRHTCATRLVERGVNIVTVKNWMGHESINTTLIYVHQSGHELEDAASALDMALEETGDIA